MRHALLIVSIVFSILLAMLPGHAQSRVALVIGNSTYRNASSLPNTQNDATDIAASFQRLGFSVKTLHNATFDDMRRALLQFGRDTRGSDMAVVYFAGHGMEVGGENWLIPVDAELRSDRDVENEAISLKSAMLQVNATTLGLVILDSCRDNPFAAQMQRMSRTRAVDRGLTRVEPTDNVLVAYAAKDGTVASDGRGRNSPFTTALLNNLEKAGVEIRFLLATVRDEVLAATNRQQQPFVYGSLSPQPIYLKPPAQPPSVAAAEPPGVAQPLTEVERAWAAVQASPSIAAMEAFVRRFGDSFYADLARVRIEELKRTAAAPQPHNAAPSPTAPAAVAPPSVSPTGGPCGSRAVVSIEPCPPTQEPPSQQAAIPPPAAGSLPSLNDRLRARFAELSVPADVAENRARDYDTKKDHKAIAVALKARRTWTESQWGTDDAAVTAMLEKCQVYYGEPCTLVAVGDKLEPASSGPAALRDMPRARYDGLFEPGQIPGANGDLRRRIDVVSYRSAAGTKAAAYNPWGSLFIVRGMGQFEAEELALKQCNDDPVRKGSDGPCFLYAVGDQVVLPQRSAKPLTPRRTDSPPSQQAAIPLPAAGSPHDRLVARLTALLVAADEAENRARDYEAEKDHKAIAVGARPTAHYTWRQSQWPTDEAAVTATLEKCQVYYGEPCVLAAVGDKVEPASAGPPVLRDMPRARYNGLFEPEQIPGANGNFNQRPDVLSYRSAAGPKAAAYHPFGRLFIVVGIGQFEAEELVLKQCNDDPDRRGRNGPCFLYAAGDQVVLPQRLVRPLAQRRAGQPQTQQDATKQQRGDNSQPPETMLPRAGTPSATELTSVAAAFDGAMRGWMVRYGVSRASVAVMKDNRLIYATGYGGRGANERLDVWSLSKAITALCISTLVKDHRLRLDDPIGPLLAPLIKKFGPLADERLASVTVAQLLSHRSGLPTRVVDNRFAPGLGEVLRRHRPRDATADMLMPSILKLHLARAPGLNYEYSNVGYLLLGQIIEFLTGQPYETACGDRVLAKAGIKRPALDPDWGHISHSAGGWSLSGPEYLAFSRLLDAQQSPVLTAETRAFLKSTDGQWTNDDKVVAYTLGVLVRPVAGAANNIFHGGAWHWDQRDSRGGPIRENRGTRFVLGGNGIAWFASFDGVSSDTHPNAYRELDEAFWRASRSVSAWPMNNEFAAMGIGPVSSSDTPQPASLDARTQKTSLGENAKPPSSSLQALRPTAARKR